MNGYVIIRNPGEFVSSPDRNPTGKSYTRSLQWAKIFPTYEAADGDRCPGNEHIVTLESQLKGRQL